MNGVDPRDLEAAYPLSLSVSRESVLVPTRFGRVLKKIIAIHLGRTTNG
jgi:hypothetical protein